MIELAEFVSFVNIFKFVFTPSTMIFVGPPSKILSATAATVMYTRSTLERDAAGVAVNDACAARRFL